MDKDRVGIDPMPADVCSVLVKAAQFSFRVYQRAGGFGVQARDIQNNKWFRILKEHVRKENIRKEAAGEPLLEVDRMNFESDKTQLSIAKNAASMPNGFAIGVGVSFEPNDSNPPTRYCNVCQKAAAAICGKCETVYFCSAACQVKF